MRAQRKIHLVFIFHSKGTRAITQCHKPADDEKEQETNSWKWKSNKNKVAKLTKSLQKLNATSQQDLTMVRKTLWRFLAVSPGTSHAHKVHQNQGCHPPSPSSLSPKRIPEHETCCCLQTAPKWCQRWKRNSNIIQSSCSLPVLRFTECVGEPAGLVQSPTTGGVVKHHPK